MRRFSALAIALILSSVLAIISPSAAVASATCSWTVMHGKQPPPTDPVNGNFLGFTSVSASSTTDAWSVGYTWTKQFGYAPLAYHWAGAKWKTVPVPVTGVPSNVHLNGVATVSPNDAWLVGEQDALSGLGPNVPLLEHWDGTTWQPVASPTMTVGSDGSSVPIKGLYAVSAVSANDVWASGYGVWHDSYNGQLQAGVIEHWDGSAWSVAFVLDQDFYQQPHQPPAPEDAIIGITTISASDVWAVANSTAVLHYDGTAWQIAQTGHQRSFYVAGSSSDNVWFSGNAQMERWDGQGFVQVPFPFAWGPGYPAPIAMSSSHTLAIDQPEGIFGWDGSAWTETTLQSIDPTIRHPLLEAAATVPGSNEVWVAGIKSAAKLAHHGFLLHGMCS